MRKISDFKLANTDGAGVVMVVLCDDGTLFKCFVQDRYPHWVSYPDVPQTDSYPDVPQPEKSEASITDYIGTKEWV